MGVISEMLGRKKYILCSGAWATELFEPMRPHDCVESWNTLYAEPVIGLCESYMRIPVDLLGTHTFAANRDQLAKHGLEKHTVSINYAGAKHAHSALQNDAVVCGLIGPVACHMPKRDDALLADAYRQQAQALYRGGAQVLWLETVMDVKEAGIALTAIRQATPCDLVCTMSLKNTPIGLMSHCGMFAHEALRSIAECKPDAVGFNCGCDAQFAVKLFEVVKEAGIVGQVPLAFKPNGGRPNDGSQAQYSPEQFALQMRHALDKGFQIIGGCCGAGPEYIRALHETHPR